MPLDEVKYEKLYEAMNNAIFEDIEKGSVLPIFTKNECICGVMKVDSRNPNAKTWLTDVIRRVTPLWQNMQLKVEDYDKLTMPNRVIGLFQYCKFTVHQIQQMLAAMNPRLNVKSWIIIRSQTIESGVQVVFDIPESDFIYLSKHNFLLYFGAGYSPLWDISMGNGEPWVHLDENGYYGA